MPVLQHHAQVPSQHHNISRHAVVPSRAGVSGPRLLASQVEVRAFQLMQHSVDRGCDRHRFVGDRVVFHAGNIAHR